MQEQEEEVQEALQWQIDEQWSGERLDKVLAALAPEHSRSRWQHCIKNQQVYVNGVVADSPKQTLYYGDLIVAAQEPEYESLSDAPEALPLDIVYEDEHILVMNKAAGMVVHPAVGNRSGTLLNAILHHHPAAEALPRAGIVHRLDKDTSGLLVVAKTLAAQQDLIEQLQTRTMGRIYLALVYRYVSAGDSINLPIGRHPRERLKMAVRADGREALTHYRIEKRFGEAATLLRVQLETGRTHQIRVHLSALKFPLVGDALYGRPLLSKGLSETARQALLNFPRQALHAHELHLQHPATGEDLSFTAPLPDDLRQLLANLAAEAL